MSLEAASASAPKEEEVPEPKEEEVPAAAAPAPPAEEKPAGELFPFVPHTDMPPEKEPRKVT